MAGFHAAAQACCAKATARPAVLRYLETLSNSRPSPLLRPSIAIRIGKVLFTRRLEVPSQSNPAIEVLPMRRPAAEIGALLALALISSTALAGGDGETPARSTPQVEKTFLIPAGEGYGVGDCLSDADSGCGQVVANAWCEAQGFASAGSFGIAAQDEYTGAVPAAPVIKQAERPIRITCQD
jgi:hypothetical protein